MSKRRLTFLEPVEAGRLLAHDEHVTLVENESEPLANSLTIVPPVKVQWSTSSASCADDQAPPGIAMPSNSALGRIVVIVTFGHHVLAPWAKVIDELGARVIEHGHFIEWNNRALSIFNVGRLFLLGKDKIEHVLLVHHFLGHTMLSFCIPRELLLFH